MLKFRERNIDALERNETTQMKLDKAEMLRESPRESRNLRRQRGGTDVMLGQQQSQRCGGQRHRGVLQILPP